MNHNPTATTLLRQGIDQYNAGNRDQAEALLRQAVALDPESEQGWLWLAAVVRDLHEAEHALQNALAANPANLETAAHLATVRSKLTEESGERFKAPTGERPAINPANLSPSLNRPSTPTPEATTTVMTISAAPFASPAPAAAPLHSYISLSAPVSPAPAVPATPIVAAPAPPITPAPVYQPAPKPDAYNYTPPAAPATSIANANATNVTYVNNNYYAAPHPPLLVLAVGPPFIVRALYFLLIGWWLTYLWVVFAWLLNLTVIGLPIGLTMLNLVPQVLTLEPIRRNFIAEYTASGRLIAREVEIPQLPLLPRALYFFTIGWWASLAWLLVAATLCATILGLPLGIWMFHRSPTITTLRRV